MKLAKKESQCGPHDAERPRERERESSQEFRVMQEVTLQVVKYWLVARNSRFISTESVNQLFSESERENRIKDVSATRTQRNQKCLWDITEQSPRMFVRQRHKQIKDICETLNLLTVTEWMSSCNCCPALNHLSSSNDTNLSLTSWPSPPKKIYLLIYTLSLSFIKPKCLLPV